MLKNPHRDLKGFTWRRLVFGPCCPATMVVWWQKESWKWSMLGSGVTCATRDGTWAAAVSCAACWGFRQLSRLTKILTGKYVREGGTDEVMERRHRQKLLFPKGLFYEEWIGGLHHRAGYSPCLVCWFSPRVVEVNRSSCHLSNRTWHDMATVTLLRSICPPGLPPSSTMWASSQTFKIVLQSI